MKVPLVDHPPYPNPSTNVLWIIYFVHYQTPKNRKSLVFVEKNIFLRIESTFNISTNNIST